MFSSKLHAGHHPAPRLVVALASFHKLHFLARGNHRESHIATWITGEWKDTHPITEKHFKQSLEIRSRFLTANDMIGSFSSLVFCHIQEINTYMNHL